MNRYIALIAVILCVACRKESVTSLGGIVADTIPLTNDTLCSQDTAAYYPCSLYGNHVIAFVDTLSDRTRQLTLLSLYDWDKVPSSLSGNPLADALTAFYQEYELSDWRIPSEEEARRLKALYNDSDLSLMRLNEVFREQDADTIALHKGAQYVRYLCHDATKTYSFHKPSNVTTAGSATTYRLRLVKTIKL